MKQILLVLTLILAGQVNSYCQHGNYWFFGYGAGLDFTDTEPKVITGSLYTWEGCAAISDQNQNLLFYSDGTYVWDRNHQLMPNGSGLNGNSSSAQSCIIVPKPGDPDLYYIFTTDAHENNFQNGLNYSVVDMRLNSGLGDVSIHNVLLYQRTCEKLTVIKHANSIDFWVISHEYGTNAYYAHLVTAAGVSAHPVITKTGALHGGANDLDGIGLIKGSMDGSKLVATLSGTNIVEIMDFNRENGTISNLTGKGFDAMWWAYGIEFSPDQSKLYVSALNELFQFDLTAGTFDDVLNSIVLIPKANAWGSIGQLQLAPDGKIYAAIDGSGHLGTIHSPNAAGIACDFEMEGLYLNGRATGFGLPNSISTFTSVFDRCATPLNLGEDRYLCDENSTTLRAYCQDCDFLWSDGSTDQTLSVNTEGLYWLEVRNENCTLRDSILIYQTPPLYVNFDTDTAVCETEVVHLRVEQEGSEITWSDWSTGNDLMVYWPGEYWVDISNGSCYVRKTVNVTFNSYNPFDLGEDIELCAGEMHYLVVYDQWGPITWSTNTEGHTLLVDRPGLYWAEIKNGSCYHRDSINVDFIIPPPLYTNFDSDTTLCQSNKLRLTASQQGSSFMWSNWSTASEIEVSTPGYYSVDADFNGCHTYRMVYVDFVQFNPFNLGNDVLTCVNNPVQLAVNDTWGQLHWSNHSTGRTLNVSTSGTYWAEMRNEYCVHRDSVNVRFEDPPVIDLGDDVSLCPDETIRLDATASQSNYVWSTGERTPFLEVNKAGTYSVVVSNPYNGCVVSDQIVVTFEECLEDLFIPNVITPNGDGKNDAFEIQGAKGTRWNIVIYNRWGRSIFESLDYKHDWDGKDMSTGVYYYSLTSQYSGKKFTGWVDVRR